VIRYKFK